MPTKERIIKDSGLQSRTEVAFGIWRKEGKVVDISFLLHIELPTRDDVKEIVKYCNDFLQSNTEESIKEQNIKKRAAYCKKYNVSPENFS